MADIGLEIGSKLQDLRTEGSDPPEDEGRKVRRKDLLNLLNFVNFQEGTIFANFRHLKYDDKLSLQAFPRPCSDEILECRWMRGGLSERRLKDYIFENFLLSNGQDLFLVKAEVVGMDEEGITFRIPDFGHEKSGRKVRRHECEAVDVRILQNGIALTGTLADFNAVSCRVVLTGSYELVIGWINPGTPVLLSLERDGRLLFSGDCVVTRSDTGEDRGVLVLTPVFNNIRRYAAREFRSQRHSLSPAPNVNFNHPLTGKRLYLQALDISSSGFSTEEFFINSTLLPGLMIPEISIEIGNHFMMKCLGQVLYRNVVHVEHGENLVRCGIVFLDMAIEDQASLSALLHQNANNCTRVCSQVDMEELWRFFFESGFIYPSKYLSILAYKEEFKKTYEKLYLKSPAIARHFIFQDRGILFGHMSMIRSNANTWLIHHHAASRSGHGMAGVAVLEQVGQYINEFHLHRSTHMNYVMCYYRKENRFPSRVFGGVARDVANPKGSSVDAFAYMHLADLPCNSSGSYQLLPAGRDDLFELKRHYEKVSGGLTLEALNLMPEAIPETLLDEEYRRHGFLRERHIFALKREGSLAAIVMVSLSDLGLNLSNLTNCIHVFVVDEEKLSTDMLASGLNGLAAHFAKDDMPLMVYPAEYLEEHAIAYEKRYILWVFNMNFLDEYFRSLRNTFKRDVHGRNESKCDDN
ncbi:MAG: hypothetical protein A2Z99_16825 [Treponema sp. GWB1_62_6]|nr:MAG: hypothetical protein A2Y36_18770 [Treponema sp. GWA1_62_8]OHE63067.1 MAG: hypothetical protein A2001_15535 [Treponema sp. GWC1_61_84]OHE65595.1 MAG: hypothetical protein A2Z99_16825 [Treponema sp. GWB1_62_6]OHE76788.1 MAG: hypothetical protein A2413_15760 [Treponema sp. RIFOXYC1_FULL_61_9]HCM26863.1 hypothetical protein [Treponema sp.]